MNVKENVMQVVLDAITMIENSESGQVHNLMYDELAESIAERLANNGLLSNVSSNGDKHLEKINDIMWNSCMIKGRDFGRKEGFKIMQVLEEWATPK